MGRRAGVLLGLAACLLLAGCNDSAAERACEAAQGRAEAHYGHLYAAGAAVVAVLLCGYLVLGRAGARPGPRHGLRLTATGGAILLASMAVGLLGYVGGASYGDHTHPCDNTISFHGNGVIVLVLLLLAVPLGALALLAIAMIALARTLYAGQRRSLVTASIVALLPLLIGGSSLANGSSVFGWAALLSALAVIVPCGVLLLDGTFPATGVAAQTQAQAPVAEPAQAPPPPFPSPAPPTTFPTEPPPAPPTALPERRPRPRPGARD